MASLGGEHERGAELLERALEIVVDGGARYFEMWVRPDLARARAEVGQLVDARRHVERCREIMGLGEKWRGRAGHVELADAAVLSGEGRADEAGIRFEEALRTLRHYKLLADEAEALHHWGRSLARAGDSAGAVAKLKEAQAIYRTHGAGTKWLNGVSSDMRKLQGAGGRRLRPSVTEGVLDAGHQ